MSKKSKVPPRKTPAKYRRGTYLKRQVDVPAPEGLGGVARDDVRWCSQERAAEITGKSANTVRRWAHGHQAIDVTSLRLLQIWVWGLIPSEAFIKRGIRIHQGAGDMDFRGLPQDIIVTPAGHTAGAGEIEAFVWLRQYYKDRLAKMDAEKTAAEQAAKPSAVIIPFEAYRRPRPKPDADLA